jgi:uncharacterized protein
MSIILQSLLGGALIGGSAAGLLLVNGRIAGISGILSGATAPRPRAWQWAFLAGLVATGAVASLTGHPAPAALRGQGFAALALAGLLVGLGTRLGGGCTSGHGVCGLGNLSPRSLVATATFMTVAGLVVFATHHLAPVSQVLARAGLS